jgi:Protein of unknown function (DUF3485)
MSTVTKKVLWVCLIVAILLGFIWQLYPLQDAQARIETLPLSGHDYVGKDVPMTEFEQKFFKGVNVIKRIYRIDNYYYFITVLDGTHNRHVVHDPYYCFTGSGWDIVKKKEIPIKDGSAEDLIISKNGREKTAIFWFSNGAENYSSPFKYWIQATMRRLTFGLSGQEPVLIMIQPLDTTTDVNWKQITDTISPILTL